MKFTLGLIDDYFSGKILLDVLMRFIPFQFRQNSRGCLLPIVENANQQLIGSEFSLATDILTFPHFIFVYCNRTKVQCRQTCTKICKNYELPDTFRRLSLPPDDLVPLQPLDFLSAKSLNGFFLSSMKIHKNSHNMIGSMIAFKLNCRLLNQYGNSIVLTLPQCLSCFGEGRWFICLALAFLVDHFESKDEITAT